MFAATFLPNHNDRTTIPKQAQNEISEEIISMTLEEVVEEIKSNINTKKACCLGKA